MKKIIAFICAVALCATLFAQNAVVVAQNGVEVPVNEIGVSYGRASIPSFVYTIGGLFGTVFTLGYAKVSTMVSLGSFGFEYHGYVHPHVAIGAIVSYEDYKLSFDRRNGNDESGKPLYKKGPVQDNHVFSVMPSFKFPWFHFSHVSMYTKAAIGATYIYAPAETMEAKDDAGNITQETAPGKNEWTVAFQVSPVGVDFGGNVVRGFAELGVGYQGLALLGVRCRF